MTTQDMKRAMIRAVPAFAALDDGDCDSLIACLRMRTLEPGAVLFEQGAPGDTMVVVGKGDLRISMVVAPGTSESIRTVTAGGVLGEMACVDPAPRSATATAATAATVFELSRDGLDALGRTVPGLASVLVGAIIRDVTVRLRDIESRVERELDQRAGQVLVAHAAPPETPTRRPSGFWRLLDHLKGE